MTKIKKFLIILLSLFVFLVLLVIGSVIYIMSTTCGDTIISEVTSSDDNYSAVSYERDCGVTTDVTINVKIIKKKFLRDDELKVFTSKGDGDLKLDWDNNTLNVECSDCGQVFNKQESWEGVKINYEFK